MARVVHQSQIDKVIRDPVLLRNHMVHMKGSPPSDYGGWVSCRSRSICQSGWIVMITSKRPFWQCGQRSMSFPVRRCINTATDSVGRGIGSGCFENAPQRFPNLRRFQRTSRPSCPRKTATSGSKRCTYPSIRPCACGSATTRDMWSRSPSGTAGLEKPSDAQRLTWRPGVPKIGKRTIWELYPLPMEANHA